MKLTMRHSKKTRSRHVSVIRYSVILLVAAYLCLCIFMRPSLRDTSFSGEECMLYYIVNADGMKGLGHSILLLVDDEGRGAVISFNGMQRSLGECLLGKSGVGKLSIGVMTAQEVEEFLLSGDLELNGDQLADNYDAALYRPITAKEYQIIMDQTAPYLAAEEAFGALYQRWATEEDAVQRAKYGEALARMGEEESLPLYQIYAHNCDHAAREMAAAVDQELREYTDSGWRMTPSGNWKAFACKAQKWGVMTLGEQTLPERLLLFFVSF